MALIMAQRPYIDVIRYEGEHFIFSGRNALRHAIWYCKAGRVCDDDSKLYNLHLTDIGLQHCMEWGTANNALPTAITAHAEHLIGLGVHAKIYTLNNGSIILSSQNNGNSPLFEFAILYPKPSKRTDLKSFIKQTFRRAAEFQTYFKSKGTKFNE